MGMTTTLNILYFYQCCSAESVPQRHFVAQEFHPFRNFQYLRMEGVGLEGQSVIIKASYLSQKCLVGTVEDRDFILQSFWVLKLYSKVIMAKTFG